MRTLLIHADGKLPNLALMRLSAHLKECGRDIELTHSIAPMLAGEYEQVYCSVIFQKTWPKVEALLTHCPTAIVGGTGSGSWRTLEDMGMAGEAVDYSPYPDFPHSIGFSQRGCRLTCKFCVVPQKEGRPKNPMAIRKLWRGEPWPKEIILLDNDFFGEPSWRERAQEIIDGQYKVSICQGINVRNLTDEQADYLSRMGTYSLNFKRRCVYTAWDNPADADRVVAGLRRIIEKGLRPANIMVYMLIGYWPGETDKDWEYRRSILRGLGVTPYPMPFSRNQITIGYQRWVVGAYDKQIPWSEWIAAGYYPTGLTRRLAQAVLPLEG